MLIHLYSSTLQLQSKEIMPVAATIDRQRRNLLRAPRVYRSLSITLSVFRIIIQVAIPNFAGYIRSTPAP
ncbi:unnamed protein product [Gulo gulo]|uniref:Uncharacterized protein n=1 Tax=Gulo gulo TaxID=48420 RepID=A0A9X9PVC9_GULGU|nr:unnamed protein product [Gulo gulo]